MSRKLRIETDKAPPSHGYRSNAVTAEGFVFTAGHIGAPMAPSGQQAEPAATLEEQVDLCMRHMEQLALAGGAPKDRFVEVAAFPVPNAFARQDVIRQRIASFLGYTPLLVHMQPINDVAMHAFLEIDGVALSDPDMSLEQAAEILRPFGQGEGLVRSGPFLFLNRMIASGANLAEQTHNLLNDAARRLEEAGSALLNLLKMTVYISEYDIYPQFNEETRRQFANFDPPARSVLIAPLMTSGSALRIDMIALPGEAIGK